MAMTKKDFIALADALRRLKNKMDSYEEPPYIFNDDVLPMIIGFCHRQNPRFNEATFRAYIASEKERKQ